VLVPRSSGTSVATWARPTCVVSRRRVLEALFIWLEFPSPSRRIFIGCHSLLWDVTVDTGYIQPMDFLAPGSRDRFDANNKANDYLFRALCQPEFDRVHTEHLACRIWALLKEAHVGSAQV
jgi:hypothetical protein